MPLFVGAQNDSVVFRSGGVIDDAVFLSYQDFRFNKGIRKEKIISVSDKNQLDFISKCLSAETLEYIDNGSKSRIPTDSVFAYVQNNTFYFNYKGNFYRVPVFGAISYFVANEVVYNTFYDPRFGSPVNTKTTEVREFIMDFYEGRVTDLTMGRAMELLSRDETLYAEFKKLRKRRQKEELYRFIRRYNDIHPVYFLK